MSDFIGWLACLFFLSSIYSASHLSTKGKKKKQNNPTLKSLANCCRSSGDGYKVTKGIRNILNQLILKIGKTKQTLRNSQCSIHSQSDICVLLCPIDNRIICP